MNLFPVGQVLQLTAWFLAAAQFILAFYIVVLDIWPEYNRSVGFILLLSGVYFFALGLLLSATNISQAYWPTAVMAALDTPSTLTGLFFSVLLLKPEWLRERGWARWPGRLIYAISLLTIPLTLADVFWGTGLWYTGLTVRTYTTGYIALDAYAAGRLYLPIRMWTYMIEYLAVPVILYVALLDRKAAPATRRIARVLMVLFVLAISLLVGLQGLLVRPANVLIFNIILFMGVGYAVLEYLGSSGQHVRRGRIQTRLTALILVTTVPLLIAVVTFVSGQAATVLEQDANERMAATNRSLTTNMYTWLDLNTSALKQLVMTPDIISMDPKRQKPILETMSAAYPTMYLVSTTDLDGVNVARNDAGAAMNYSDRDWFRGAKVNEALALQTVIGKTSGKPALVAGMPIRDGSGKVVGVGMFASELDTIAHQVKASQVGATGVTFVVDAHDVVVAHSSPTFSTAELHNYSSDPAVAALRHGARGIVPTFTDAQGKRWRAYVEWMDNGWGVIVEQQEDELLQSLRVFQTFSWAVVAISVGMLLVLAWISIRQTIEPIRSLTDTASAISNGDWSRTASIESEDEIGVLARAFNTMTAQLRGLIASLEQRVAERTADLERRTSYLEASAEVGRAATSILDTSELIRQVVERIQVSFELYYVGLFLTDKAGEWAVLQKGTGEAGKAMLSRGHRLRIGGNSMIGWCVSHAEARIALEADQDVVRMPVPELPETRSEAALPLRSRGQVIGALSVQSNKPGVFDADTIAVLQSMADQVAVALDNSRLFVEGQAALETARRAYGQLSHEAWAELLRTETDLGYRSSELGTTSAQDTWSPEMEQALHEGRLVRSGGADSESRNAVAVPIKVRDNVVGVINTSKPNGEWTAEEIGLLQSAADQVGAALESARLYDDTRRRAASEQMINMILARIRSGITLEQVLTAAVQSIGQSLGATRVAVRLLPGDERRTGNGNGHTPRAE